MNLLQDVITYVRRIIKSPSNAQISDALIIDYINRFWVIDVDARMQLFDLKTKYAFQTTPGVDKYNMPLYDIQNYNVGGVSNQMPDISFYPVYQGFLGPAYVNGVPVSFETKKEVFYNNFPNVTQYNQSVGVGNGGSSYTLQVPLLSGLLPSPNNPPFNALLRGHVDISGIIATGNNQDPPLVDSATGSAQVSSIPVTSVQAAVYITSIDANGNNVVITDSGQFLNTNINCGLLINPGNAPNGNQPLTPDYSATSNVVNYLTGQIYVNFPVTIPLGNNINVQCYFFQSGLPRSILYYNNTLTLRVPPAMAYLVELDAYLSPAAYLQSNAAIQFGYMAEYIARGAARKILSDTGDQDQFAFYEPLFREQENLVWKRSQRQFTATRTPTIYSQGQGGGSGNNNMGQGGMF